MESVFYAKQCNDTIFFDELATKKNEDKLSLYFGAIIFRPFGCYDYYCTPCTTTGQIMVTARITLIGVLLNSNKVG